MYSLAFPNMFSSGVHTDLHQDHKASFTNVRLALLSSKGGLFGDPEYGSLLKSRLYSQNNVVLRDLIIDDIYTTIKAFVPQVELDRKDITVESDGYTVTANIKCKNITDYELNTFTISLTD